jgi:hypothetical protein
MFTAFRFCMGFVKQHKTGLGVLLSKRKPNGCDQRIVCIWKEFPMYVLTITIIVLGLFISISILPMFFTEQDLDSLVLLPQ